MKPRCNTLGLINQTQTSKGRAPKSIRDTSFWGGRGTCTTLCTFCNQSTRSIHNTSATQYDAKNINKEGDWCLKLNGNRPTDEKSEISAVILPSLGTTKMTIRCFQVDLQAFYFLSFQLFCSAFCKTYWITPILLLNCVVIKNTLVYRWWTGSKFCCWFTHHNVRTNTGKPYESNGFTLMISFSVNFGV